MSVMDDLRTYGMDTGQIISACKVLTADNPGMTIPQAARLLLDKEIRKAALVRAAAPDLLAACKALIDDSQARPGAYIHVRGLGAVLAAIAKAEPYEQH